MSTAVRIVDPLWLFPKSVEQFERHSGQAGSELIDISELPMPVDDAGDSIKDPAFSEKMAKADGLAIVTPEYNHNSYRSGCTSQGLRPDRFSSDAIA